MGSGNSSRRRDSNMEEDGAGVSGRRASDSLPENPDLQSILSYLIRSGQVRILSADGYDDDDDEDDETFIQRATALVSRPPEDACAKPDTKHIDESELRLQVMLSSGQTKPYHTQKNSVCKLLQKREAGIIGSQCFSHGDRCAVASNYLPNKYEEMDRYSHKAFCGTYSQDGDIFLTACQDRCLRVYDTSNGKFKLMKQIHARDVGWSILDVAFSPDGNFIIYSSWSDIIHLCAVQPDKDTHEALRLFPDTDNSFCLFSLTFSQDNQEIMGGANDGCIYVFDREKNTRSLKIDAHEDDVNAVAFADDSSQILFSGADDGLCKVWDRRTLREEDPTPVGTLAGHTDGITYIDSKRDGRYLISNCKDQTIKLWDMRRFSSEEAVLATKREVSRQNWDYRWQRVPSRVHRRKASVPGDSSLLTYRGHCIQNTLVRCRFSPSYSTGQRYIYTGCATGAVIIYDLLTGEKVTSLEGHTQCVRDVSWHPYENTIMSTSWDATIAGWFYDAEEMEGMDIDPQSSQEEDESDDPPPRRSRRLKDKRRSDNKHHHHGPGGRVIVL